MVEKETGTPLATTAQTGDPVPLPHEEFSEEVFEFPA
jgi:hypothetical protein